MSSSKSELKKTKIAEKVNAVVAAVKEVADDEDLPGGEMEFETVVKVVADENVDAADEKPATFESLGVRRNIYFVMSLNIPLFLGLRGACRGMQAIEIREGNDDSAGESPIHP